MKTGLMDKGETNVWFGRRSRSGKGNGATVQAYSYYLYALLSFSTQLRTIVSCHRLSTDSSFDDDDCRPNHCGNRQR